MKTSNSLSGFKTVSIQKVLASPKTDRREGLQECLSRFSCPKNPDIEYFLKRDAISYSEHQRARTYLVAPTEDTWEYVGYYTISLKPLEIPGATLTGRGKSALLPAQDAEKPETDLVCAFLIAHLGKNFSQGLNSLITGDQLLDLALRTIRQAQEIVGGRVALVEAPPEEKALSFYLKNGFQLLHAENRTNASKSLLQLIRMMD